MKLYERKPILKGYTNSANGYTNVIINATLLLYTYYYTESEHKGNKTMNYRLTIQELVVKIKTPVTKSDRTN